MSFLNNFNSLKKIAIIILLFSVDAFAATASGITYHGRILNPDGTYVVDPSVQFKMQVRTPDNQNCLMYEEIQTQDLSTSNGAFAITINDGSGTRTDSSGYAFDQIFGNYGTFSFPVSVCASGSGTDTWAPSPSDGRAFQVYFKTSTMGSWEPLPPQAINFAPMAIEAKQVSGFPAASLFRVDSGTAPQSIAALTPTQANNLIALANGTSTQYVPSNTTGGATLPSFSSNPPSPASGDIWYDSTNKTLKYYDGTAVQNVGAGSGSGTVTSVSGTAPISVATATTTPVVSIQQADATHDGYLSSADWSTFNSKLGSLPSNAFVNGGNSFSGAATLGTNDSNSLAFKTNNSTAMTIDTSGKVGIGTATPPDTLSVYATDANPVVHIENTNSTAARTAAAVIVNYGGGSAGGIPYLLLQSSRGSKSATSPSVLNDSLGEIHFYGMGSTAFKKAATITSAAQETFTDASYSGNLSFNTASGGSLQPRMTVTSSGSVGIGTTSPGATLEINPGNVFLTRTINDAFGPNIIQRKSRGAIIQSGDEVGYMRFDGYDGSAYQPAANIGVIVDGTPGASDMPGAMIFSTTPDGANALSERMRITNAGNVGIGTNSPQAKLDVAGQIHAQVYNAGTSLSIDWNNGNNQYTAPSGNACGAVTFTNLIDGGSYTLAVQGVTSGTCTFSQSGLTFVYSPSNAAVTSDAVYTFLRMGSKVYVSWVTGFN